VGRPPGRFVQHRRLDRLEDALEAHPAGLDIGAIAALLRITPRSVRRYLAKLERHTELERVPVKAGGAVLWRIKPSERGRTVALRRTQAYGLLALRRVLEPLRGSALFDEMDVVMRQLLLVARRPARVGVKGEVPADQRLEERFVVHAPSPRSYAAKGEELDDLFTAVASSRVLRFRYGNERIAAEPYALVVHGGAVLCVAHDLEAGRVRVFSLDRISETHAREGETFVLPPDFDVQHYLQGDFGVGASARTRVVVEFDARVADEVRARRLHPAQKIATAPDGRLRVSVPVDDLDAAVAWVLPFGAQARVIEPPELVAIIVRTLRTALARYEAAAPTSTPSRPSLP